MKNQYDMYKAKLDDIPEGEKLEAIYKWTKGDWISLDTFRLLIGHVIHPNAILIDTEK